MKTEVKEQNKVDDNINDMEENFDEDQEFVPCSKCDGHPACEDFGCAHELGLGKMVKKDIPHGSDYWG